MAALLIQQAITIGCGAGLFGLAVSGLPLLAVALLAWRSWWACSATRLLWLALLGMGAALGVLARSLSQMSAAYDIGGMILSSLGGALVPLSVMPPWVRHIAPVSPGYRAVAALRAALRGDATATFSAAAVLGGFALAFAWWQACGRAVGGSGPPPCKAGVSRREKSCPELSI